MLIGSRGSRAGAAGQGTRMRDAFRDYAAGVVKQELMEHFLPLFSFAEENRDVFRVLVEKQMSQVMPLYHFREGEEAGARAERLTIEGILKAEALDEEARTLSDADALTGGDLQALLWAENEAAREADAGGEGPSAQPGNEQEPASPAESEPQEQQEAPAGQAAWSGGTDFLPHMVPEAKVDLEGLKDYETLVKSLYTVDSSTMIGSDQLNVEALSGRDLSISKESEGPQILIYHTHSQEAFADSVPGDRATSIVGVGDFLTRILTEVYGYQVLHHDGTYDVPSRDNAYSAALPAIERILEENPSIQVVIDLHRDAMDENTHLVMDLDGRPTARFMFFNGLSRTRKTGNISYLYNENLEDNLAFSFQLQVKALEYYPGLTRKIYLKAYRYNMHLRPRNLLIELGAQNNTVEEAMNACEPMAHILDMVLSGQE